MTFPWPRKLPWRSWFSDFGSFWLSSEWKHHYKFCWQIDSTLWGIKIAPLLVLQELNQADIYYVNFFASSYLNEFVTKRCKNVTFADQDFLQYEIQ